MREHDLHLAVAEAAVQHRVPEDDLLGRAEPDGVGVRGVREVGDVLDCSTRIGSIPCCFAYCRAAASRSGRRSGSVEERYGEMKAKSAPRPTKAGAAASHQRRGKRPASAITITSAKQMKRNSAPSSSQFVEQRLDVAAVGLVVAPAPPDLGQPERHLRDPDEREPDHPEQHPRPDPARRRLAREADPPARVGEQHADQHELGDDELDPEEPLVALRARDRLRRRCGRVDPFRARARSGPGLPERPRGRHPEAGQDERRRPSRAPGAWSDGRLGQRLDRRLGLGCGRRT